MPGFLVIELHGCFLDEFTPFIKAAEEIRCGLAVGFGGILPYTSKDMPRPSKESLMMP